MKITKEQSDNIYQRYLYYKDEGKLKKKEIYRLLSDEFSIGVTTAYDHSRGREKNNTTNVEVKTAAYGPRESTNAKILLFDIETFANLAYVWGKWDQNVIDFEREWFVLSFCYKWYHEDEIHSVSLPDFEAYKDDKTNDYYVTEAMWNLFNEADIVVAHNGDKFDIKKMYARFIYHGFPPPAPFKSIDTLKVARKYFNMNSNKLDDIGRYLGIGRKVVHTGWDLWKRCFLGEKEAWDEMIEYNTQDVVLLEKVYNKFKPYINNHPNLNLYNETNESCPNCGSSNLQKRGYSFSRVTKSQRYQCTDCGAWSSGNKVVR